MILDRKERLQLQVRGAKVTPDGPEAPRAHSPTDNDHLLTVLNKLEALLTRPAAVPHVTVSPPQVNITAPKPPAPVRQWRFVLTKDHAGHTTEIVATALD